MPLATPTMPLRYSFFQGLKNVFTRRGRENNDKKALFNETKYFINPKGASRNQNLKNSKGRAT